MNKKHYKVLSTYATALGVAFTTFIASAQTVLIGTNINDGSFESIAAKADFSTPVSGDISIPYWGATLVNTSNAPVGAPSDSGAQIGGNVVEQGGAGAFWQPGGNSTAFNLATNYTIALGDQFVLTWFGSTGTGGQQTVTLFSQSPNDSIAPYYYVPIATLATADGAANPAYSLGTSGFKQYTLTYTATAADVGNYIGLTVGDSGTAYTVEDNFTLVVLPASGSSPVPDAPVETPSGAATAVLAGTNVTLSAAAHGTPTITFQWQTDGGSGGTLTNIPGATGTNLVVATTGWLPGVYHYDFVASNPFGTNTSSGTTITIVSVLMVDIGPNPPTPGVNDVSQLLNSAQNDDGFNYYTDNGPNHDAWNGQTFTTGNAPTGYLLTSLAWKSAGNGNSFGTEQLYDLYIYSLSDGGATATTISSYQMYGGGTENDWFQFEGLNTPLAANTQYAYTLGRDTTAGGWEHIGNQGGNPYSGGQICEIPSEGGAVTYGPTGASDTAFDIGLSLSQAAFAPLPTYTPDVTPIYAGTVITLDENAVGAPPLFYQWMADNGTGTLVNVNGATNAQFVVDTTGFAPGNFEYAVTVTNAHGSSTSPTLTTTVVAASAPQIVTDITPAPSNEGYVGQDLSFTATFAGTLPITYQWLLDTGSGPQPITGNPSAVSNTLVLDNVQLSQAGVYSVRAHNSSGNQVSSSSTLTVLSTPAAPAPNTYGATVLSEGPLAYWRLNEDADPSTGVLPAYDATGHGFDGIYGQYTQNGFDGINGPQPPAFPGFEATNFALATETSLTNSWVTVPPLNLSNDAVTITMWIYPTANEPAFGGLFYNRPFGAGLGFGGTLNASGMPELGYTWNTNAQSTWSYNSGLYPLINQWSFVALVIAPAQATIYLYYVDPNTGQPDLYSAVNPVPNGPAPFDIGTTTTIGTDAQNLLARAFSGSIDEVAVFNKALTSDQLESEFAQATGNATVSITKGLAGSLTLTWSQSQATLLQATSVSGPWITNSTASSPYTVAATNSQMFFKLIQP